MKTEEKLKWFTKENKKLWEVITQRNKQIKHLKVRIRFLELQRDKRDGQ